MRRQLPSIRNPNYPLAYRIYRALKRPSHPWVASDIPFAVENHQLTSLSSNGFIISRGKTQGKGGTAANVWVFDPAVIENLVFIKSRQTCAHVSRDGLLFGDVYCRRLKHRMSIHGCRECIKFQIIHPERTYDPQSCLQQWGIPLP